MNYLLDFFELFDFNPMSFHPKVNKVESKKENTHVAGTAFGGCMSFFILGVAAIQVGRGMLDVASRNNISESISTSSLTDAELDKT